MNFPVIEFKVRDLGQQVTAALAAHHHEIEEYVERGVREAMEGMGEEIARKAAAEATAQVYVLVEHYFQYGEGHKAIQAAIEAALAPVAAALRSASTKE